MSSENWHEERIRLTAQLKALESGRATGFNRATSQLPHDGISDLIDRVRARLTELDGRLGAQVDQPPLAKRIGDNSPNPLPVQTRDDQAAESGGDPGRSA